MYYGNGACIFTFSDTNLTIQNTSFEQNLAKGQGGALFLAYEDQNQEDFSFFNIRNSKFISNQAVDGSSMYISGKLNTFLYNTSFFGDISKGSVISSSHLGSFEFFNVSFQQNNALHVVYCQQDHATTLSLNNCLFQQNRVSNMIVNSDKCSFLSINTTFNQNSGIFFFYFFFLTFIF